MIHLVVNKQKHAELYINNVEQKLVKVSWLVPAEQTQTHQLPSSLDYTEEISSLYQAETPDYNMTLSALIMSKCSFHFIT